MTNTPPAAPPGRSEPLERLNGLIERVTFHSEESGFGVLRVKVRGHRDLVTVIGTAPEIKAGEWMEAEGQWVIDKEHGQQFKAIQLRTTPPTTAEGMQKYLASGLIKGIGPALAGRLVTAFGMQIFEVIEKNPERLHEVSGIGKGRQGRIVSGWNDQKLVREIMVFLHSHGVSTSRAFRIYKTYGAEAIEKVREDPYRLKTADQIAEKLGIGKQSDLRARAGIEYTLQELTEEGHCAFRREGLAKKAQKMLEIPADIIESAINHGLEQGRLVEGPDGQGELLIYLAAFDLAERKLSENLAGFFKGPHPCPAVDVPRAIAWVESKEGLTLAAAQRAAEERIAHPASQSHILIGSAVLKRSDPEFFALTVGNYILGGGGFVSRLMAEVREKRGLAYSAYSYFSPRVQEGPFQAGLQTKKEQANEALVLVRKVIGDYVTSGPTEKELKAAKDNLVGGFALRIDSNRKILDNLANIGFYGLPLNYLDTWTTNVTQVTAADIRAAFKRHVRPDALSTVVVGAP